MAKRRKQSEAFLDRVVAEVLADDSQTAPASDPSHTGAVSDASELDASGVHSTGDPAFADPATTEPEDSSYPEAIYPDAISWPDDGEELFEREDFYEREELDGVVAELQETVAALCQLHGQLHDARSRDGDEPLERLVTTPLAERPQRTHRRPALQGRRVLACAWNRGADRRLRARHRVSSLPPARAGEPEPKRVVAAGDSTPARPHDDDAPRRWRAALLIVLGVALGLVLAEGLRSSLDATPPAEPARAQPPRAQPPPAAPRSSPETTPVGDRATPSPDPVDAPSEAPAEPAPAPAAVAEPEPQSEMAAPATPEAKAAPAPEAPAEPSAPADAVEPASPAADAASDDPYDAVAPSPPAAPTDPYADM